MQGSAKDDQFYALLKGARSQLRAVAETDIPYLHKLAIAPETAFRWRLRGLTPLEQDFRETLRKNVLCQFVVCGRDEAAPSGLIQCFNADLRHGHAHISFLIDPGARRRGWPMEAFLLFTNYLFAGWNLHKIYLDGLVANIGAFARNSPLKEEGRLPGHVFQDGDWHDVIVCALYRDEFLANAQPLLEAIRGHQGEAA